MAEHNDLGKSGENAAVAYLEQKGYLIRDRNWRRGHFELDIVAAKDNELCHSGTFVQFFPSKKYYNHKSTYSKNQPLNRRISIAQSYR